MAAEQVTVHLFDFRNHYIGSEVVASFFEPAIYQRVKPRCIPWMEAGSFVDKHELSLEEYTVRKIHGPNGTIYFGFRRR